MARKLNARQDAFARAQAEGRGALDAYLQAGYEGKSRQKRNYANELARNPEIRARVEALRDEMTWGGTADIAPVIQELIGLARRVGDKPTAAQMVAARGILVEIARLKGQLARSDAPAPDLPPQMSHEEWLATYAVKR
jgi:hypothetical protein